MSTLWFYRDPIDRLHQEALEAARRGRFAPPNVHHNHAVEQRAVQSLKTQINRLGLRLTPTVRNAPFDFWIEGVWVELKAAGWHQFKNTGRYQAAIRNYLADILIFDCINGTDHWHIIPMANIKPRKSIAVWQYDPAQSAGQWLPFLENWQILLDTAVASPHAWQPPLFNIEA